MLDPRRVDLALAFLNSRHLYSLPDALADGNSAARWLRGDGFVGVDEDRRSLLPALEVLAGGGIPAVDAVATARAAREALLALIDGELEPAAALNDLSSQLPVRLALTPEGELTPTPATDGLRAVAAHAIAVLAEVQLLGLWDRLGRCQNEACRWVYLDRSRNRSKVWCDMRGCGAQAKARSYRARTSTRS
jgi:predicted RNA-binding Zn ribbon-like protein